MKSAVGSLTIIGRDQEPAVLRLLEFADRILYRWLDPDDPDNGPAIAECGSLGPAGFRAVLGGQRTLERPTPLDLARVIGLDPSYRQDKLSELIIVGAGPGGLALAR
jgi:thioredoxin reductase (NADPH)